MLSGDNGILQKATEAKTQTGVGQEKEQLQLEVLGSYEKNGSLIIGTLNSNIKSHISGITTDDAPQFPLTVTYTSTGNKYEIYENGNVKNIQITDRTGILVGDYINYTPDVASETTYPVSILTDYSGSTSNSSNIIQNSLNWQVLRIYRDGSLDLIGSVTSQSIGFQGLKGYTYGAYLMDDICKTLYSRIADGIEARSVDLEDFNYWLNQSTGGVIARDTSTSSYGCIYGNSETYATSTGNSKYPKFYKVQTNESEPGSLNNDSSYESNEDLTVTQTAYNIAIDNTNFSEGYKALYSSSYYWLASRYADCLSSNALFGLRLGGKRIRGDGMFYSFGDPYSDCKRPLRPVVHLKSSTKIVSKSGTTGDKHQITNY